jgi:hypothetical protein
MFPNGSMRNVTVDGVTGVCAVGSPHVVTSRVGRVLSITVPPVSAICEPSVRWCSQREPTCQSETLLWPQYAAVVSASVSASQTASGVLLM